MKTIQVTDEQYTLIQHALSVQNDISNDTLFEEFNISLYPDEQLPIILTAQSAKVLRDDIAHAIQKQIAWKELLNKFDLKVNDQGYSI